MKSSSPQKPVQDMEIKAGIIPGEGIIVEGGKIIINFPPQNQYIP